MTGRNLIICCDGTGNEFGKTNTSVVRIVRSVATVDGSQLVYYDPGIGTFPEPGMMTGLGKRVSEAIDLAFATGLQTKVMEVYSFLMDSWQPGDQVYLFGFSRGAYTVRVLAAMLHSIGLLHPKSSNLLPYAMRLFASLRSHGATVAQQAKYWDVCDDFRRTFGRSQGVGKDRRFPVRYEGVWDAVSSVGYAWEPKSFPFTRKNPSVETIRHAISLDERRCFFRQNRVAGAESAGVKQDVAEVWYPGVHSDVGGGYPEAEGGLWRAPFQWLADEAAAAGLRFDPARLTKVTTETPPSAAPWLDPQHESLTGVWWLAEYYPKMSYNHETKKRGLKLGRGRPRFVHDGAVLHWSVTERLRCDPKYDPPALSDAFKVKIRAAGPTRVSTEYHAAG